MMNDKPAYFRRLRQKLGSMTPLHPLLWHSLEQIYYLFINISLLSSFSFVTDCFYIVGYSFATGMLRFGVWRSAFRAKGKGIVGNFEGEGRILGRLLVVSKQKGIVFQYDEKEFGDHADLKDVLDAAQQLV